MMVKDIIKKARINKNMTMEELGEYVGVSKATISRWESGNIASMKQSRIAKLCKALDLSPVVLVPEMPQSRPEIKMTSNEVELLNAYRQLMPNQQAAILTMIKTMQK